jgi:hypothetical protein
MCRTLHQYVCRTTVLALVLPLCVGPICASQKQSGTQSMASQSGSTASAAQVSNGISVGRPKVFDNRTLTLMLESLSNSLQNIQFVNRDSLAAAFNFLQGSRSSETVSNLSITPLPLPSLHQESAKTTGNATSTGVPLPDTTSQKTTVDRAAVTPQAPTLDNPPAFSGFNPTFGQNPSDLLNDQVNLTYQIFNLRMILERSLSDRLLDNDQPRRQAVLGFNVTIDPPRTANDAVAVVEIRLNLSQNCPTQDCLSLVSLMPQEKTYNSAALSTKSNSFGGAAVVNMFQVGFSERRRGQIFYLYRDNDTLSYERMDEENPNQVVFGWMFRPVLGRRSVSPGLRQLFAIVSLPSDDAMGISQNGPAGKREIEPSLAASITTKWKKYDKETMTSYEERDTNRAGRFRDAFSFGLTKPELFGPRYTNTAQYNDIAVHSTETYQHGLTPRLSGLSWKLIGDKSVVISAQGDNFFTGTQVLIGDKVYASPADGLIIKSNQAFDLATGIDALVNGRGSIIGRYGSAVPLLAAVDAQGAGGISIVGVSVSPSSAGSRALQIQVVDQQAQYATGQGQPSLSVSQYIAGLQLKWGKPIITVNGKVAPPPYDYDYGYHPGRLTLRAVVPDSFFSNGGGLVRVSFPFLPEQWTATWAAGDPASDFQITRLSDQSILIYTTNSLGFNVDPTTGNPAGPGTSFCWKIIAGDNKPIPLRSATCLPTVPAQQWVTQQRSAQGSVGAKASAEPTSTPVSTNAVVFNLGSKLPDKMVLVAPYGAVFPLDVPKLLQTPPAPSKPKDLNQYDAAWIDVPVKDVSKVAFVEANNMLLKYRIQPAADDGTPPKSIQVEVTRELTSKPGDVELTVLDKSGKPVGGIRLHISAVSEKGEKQ